jgi:hypothetical protein
MKTFEHVPDIEGFVKPNDDLAASRLPTDEHIIDSVLQKKTVVKTVMKEYSAGTVPRNCQEFAHKLRALCRH